MTTPTIQTANVKVMRSYDYCHFEVVLGSTEATTPELVDELRKTAARLADKAVEQYRIAKEDADDRLRAINTTQDSDYERRRYEKALAVAECDRTEDEKATIKAWGDAVHRAHRAPYDYEDDWQADEDDDSL